MGEENSKTLYFNSDNNAEKFEPQTDKLSSSIVQSWTPQALKCYKLNCDCTKCEISQLGFSFVCQMKNVVDELLKKGEPEKEAIANIY